MKHAVVYHMALRLFSLVRYKDYRNAIALATTLIENLKEVHEGEKREDKVEA